MMVRPTPVEPVKATLSISMWEARAAPRNLFRSLKIGDPTPYLTIRIHNIALHKEGGHNIYDFFFLEISSLI